MQYHPSLKVSLDKVSISKGTKKLNFSNPEFATSKRVGKFLIVFGQIWKKPHLDVQSLPAVGVLDLCKRTWRWITYVGRAIDEPKPFLYDGSLYVYAAGDWKNHWSDDLTHFDLVLEELSSIPTTGEQPPKTYGCSADYLENHNCLVVVGGEIDDATFRYTRSNGVHMLLMPHHRWVKPTVKGSPPEPRHMHASCAHHGILYIYAGVDRQFSYKDRLFMLTVEHSNKVTWSSVNMPGQSNVLNLSKHFALTPIHEKLLFCAKSSQLSPDILGLYDPATEEFEDLQLPIDSTQTVGFRFSTFRTEDGHSIGLLGGENTFNHYFRISLYEP